MKEHSDYLFLQTLIEIYQSNLFLDKVYFPS